MQGLIHDVIMENHMEKRTKNELEATDHVRAYSPQIGNPNGDPQKW